MRPIRSVAVLLTAWAAAAVAACTPRADDAAADAAAPVAVADSTPPVPLAAHPAWARDAAIYEVNIRQFTPEGTFTALLPHLARLDSLGVDILWLMPVQPIGVEGRKGTLGSYYSIKDYRATNPEFGTPADLKAVIDSAHALGLKVILDWVANHTARDHAWIAAHPDWYTRRADGTVSNPRNADGTETDWTDVADLNYGNPAMRAAMIADMAWWVREMGVDGFRCDVAWGVGMDFWRAARAALLRERADLFLLAEAEGAEYHAAFDATYGWALHHLMNQLAQGKDSFPSLDTLLAKEDRTYPANAMRMMFTSNHDENSWQGTEFERMGDNHRALFVLAATLRGSLPLVYTGQEAGLAKRLRFFEKDTVSWGDQSAASFYRTLLELKAATPALWNGADGGTMAKLAGSAPASAYAFTRTEGSSVALVAVNLGAKPATVRYTGLAAPGAYRDAFSGASETLAASGTLVLPPHGYRVLTR